MAATVDRGLVLYTGAPEWHEHSAKIEGLREGVYRHQIATVAQVPWPCSHSSSRRHSDQPAARYVRSNHRTHGRPQAWQVAAILAACLVGLHVVGKAAELTALKRSESTLDKSIGETFRRLCPATDTCLMRGGGWSSALPRRRAADRAGLLPALQAVVQARTVAPGTTLQALSFRQGTVEMKLSAKDASSLDHMSQSLRASGWQGGPDIG